ncbi:MAG TPA: transposase [Acidobacteriaceae bacterium]
MPWGLRRYQHTGDLHFLTFSCYRRRPNLSTSSSCTRFESSLEETRARYNFYVLGYVVMPEHVHLLVTEPEKEPLSKAIQALKQSVSRHLKTVEPFWQLRYYDFNVRTERKRIEKLRYIHRNPVTRGLVASPEEWPWSSFRQYAMGINGAVSVLVPWRIEQSLSSRP